MTKLTDKQALAKAIADVWGKPLPPYKPQGFMFGNATKAQSIGDGLLSMYVNAVQGFVADRRLLFMIPQYDLTPAAYFVQFSGYDPSEE